jgi:ribonuclease HII
MIAGIDEAGRGPLAGPVVSAAVILPDDYTDPLIDDSKRLTPGKRAFLYDRLYKEAVTVGIGIVDAVEIDRINILQATRLAMAMAVKNLSPQPDYLLIDGNVGISLTVEQEPVVRGDSLSISIAAASIIAKVTRDRMMEQYNLDYPEYGFAGHKGYPTKAHRAAVLKYGFTPIHRASFTVKA